MARISVAGGPTNWTPIRPGQHRGETVLVPVAEQRKAGVPPDETVTIAEQKSGEPLPDSLKGDEGSSPGISSSTSGSKPDKSGSSRQATASSGQSPVPDAESPSSPGRQAARQTSSTASTTSGSTRKTGSGQQSRKSSSAD